MEAIETTKRESGELVMARGAEKIVLDSVFKG
jgi:hypothetical protein